MPTEVMIYMITPFSAMDPARLSVLPKNSTSRLINSSVLNSAAQKPVTAPRTYSGSDVCFSADQTTAASAPTSTRDTKRCTNIRKGL